MPINTKKVTGRRDVHFASLAEVRVDVEQLRDAAADGSGSSIESLGNWSPGQAMQHLARFMTCSLDGFGKVPFWIRPMGVALQLIVRDKILTEPPPAGIKLSKDTPFIPDASVDTATGAQELIEVIERVEGGAVFIPKSPFLGPLTREKWITLHLRHSELHLSFFKVAK